MNPVYICGDSFGSVDKDFNLLSWTQILAQKFPVVNLSKICASNLHISLQVDRAIEQQASYIIYLATTSTRHDVELHPAESQKSLLDRFVDLQHPDQDCDLVSYSSRSLDSTTRFTSRQLELLKHYHAEFDNLELNIYLNQVIIESTLDRLIHSGIKFCFDQGGFEHASFGTDKKYFERYSQHRSAINIWDYALKSGLSHRPYHHIKDPQVHQSIAEYYNQKIINEST